MSTPIPLRLTVYQGNERLAYHRFERDIVKIGRLASAHLKLEDKRVSRIHAVIEAGGSGLDYAVIDMGSAEGTFVNGHKVSKQKLADGDEIVIGEYRIEVAVGESRATTQDTVSADVVGSAPPVVMPTDQGWESAVVSPSEVQTPLEASVIQPSVDLPGVHPSASAAGMPASNPNVSVAGMPASNPNVSVAGMPASNPNVSAAGMPASNPNLSAAGMPASSPNASAAGMPASNPVAGGMPASNPNLSAAGMPASSPNISVAGMSAASPSASTAGMPSVNPSVSVSGMAAVNPSVSVSGMPASGHHYPAGGYGAAPTVSSYSVPTAIPGVGFHPTPQPSASAPAAFPGAIPVGPNESGFHHEWSMSPPVPNNLASAAVPDDQRALEIKLIWGNSVVETLTVTNQPFVTLGDERRVSGFGPFQKILRCDLEVPSGRLPAASHRLAERQGVEGTTYSLNLPAGLSGRVERADGMVVPLELIYEGQHGGEADGSGGALYVLRAEETLYLGYAHFVLQIRYVRRTELAPIPLLARMNYIWANTLILAIFFHAVAIASFLATPDITRDLADELYKNRNRFIETRLKLAEKKDSGGGLLTELKKGTGNKAKKKSGKAGRRTAKKTSGRSGTKGKPNEKEQARRALDKLLGLGGKGKAAGIFGGSGLDGALKNAMGGLRGRRVGDARGLGGLGTRGGGPGGGGMAMTSVGLGHLGTAGRGGGLGGVGYGSDQAGLGGKKERDIDITAGQAIVRGSLSKEIIRRVIQKHQAQIRYCYEKELQRAPGLYGKIATEFIIDASGFVTTAKVYQSTMNNKEVERCVTSKIRTWRFPKPKGGGIVVVKYPFLFKASG